MFHVEQDRRKTVTRARIRIYGAVQGVGFRYFVRQTARRLGLAGWVRNLPDGSVELEAAGDADAVDQLARAVARGPALARVENVERLEAGTDELPVPFEVRKS